MSNSFKNIDDVCFDALDGFKVEPSADLKKTIKQRMFYRNLFKNLWFRLAVFFIVTGSIATIVALNINAPTTNLQTASSNSSETNPIYVKTQANTIQPSKNNNLISNNESESAAPSNTLVEKTNSTKTKTVLANNIVTNKNSTTENKLTTNNTSAEQKQTTLVKTNLPVHSNKQQAANNNSENEDVKINQKNELQTDQINQNTSNAPQVISAKNENKNKENNLPNELAMINNIQNTNQANAIQTNAIITNSNQANILAPNAPKPGIITQKSIAANQEMISKIAMKSCVLQTTTDEKNMKDDTLGIDISGKPIIVKNPFFIGIHYAPIFVTSKYASGNTEFNQTASTLNDMSKTNLGHQIGLSFTASKFRWFLESGLYVSIINNENKFSYHLQNPRMVNKTINNGTPYDYTDGSHYFNIDTAGYYHYFWTQDSTIHVTDSAWVSTFDSTQVKVFDTIQTRIFDTLKTNMNNTSYYFEIPLLLGYEIVGKSIGLAVKGGFIGGYTYNAKGNLYSDENAYLLNSTSRKDFRTLQFSLYLGMSIKYHINEKITFVAEPYYRRWMQPIYATSKKVNANQTGYGIKVGLIYEF